MLLASIAIAITYATLTGLGGWLTLLRLGFTFKDSLIGVIVGFLFVEGCAFFLFAGLGLAGFNVFAFSYVLNAIALIIGCLGAARNEACRKALAGLATATKDRLPAFGIALLILALYVVETRGQLKSALGESGLIYQDVIFHSGIVNSIIEFGFPLNDIHQSGNILKYHIFSHFLTAKMSFLSGAEPYKVYLTSAVTVSTLFFVLVAYSIVWTETAGTWQEGRRRLMSALVVLAFFLSGVMLGGTISTSFLSAFFLSASYCWQMIVLMVIAALLLENLQTTDVRRRSIALIALLSSLSVVAKLSAAPLLLAGFGSLWIYTLFFDKTIQRRVLGLLLLSLVAIVLVVAVFFVRPGGTGGYDILRFNFDYTNQLPLVFKLGLNNSLISLPVFVICTLSFRFILLLNPKSAVTWFLMSMLATGWIFSLIFTNNPAYFLLPALTLSGLYAAIAFVHWVQQGKSRLVTLGFLAVFALSFYPVASFGFGLSRRVLYKSNYFPLSKGRVELYQWLTDNTTKSDVIFTTSAYANELGLADNYYPAALSGRKFLLGGYRFGDEHTADFEMRRKLVDTFTVNNREQHEFLKQAGVNIVLIESVGNKLPVNDHLGGSPEFVENDLYSTVFKNNAGWILRRRD
jgi:hypothetical protein